jgi:hypothetical protein
MPKLLRFQDRYPVSRSTRARWLKDPLLPEPDLIAGGVCYFTAEKLDRFDRLRTERERANRTTVKASPKEDPPQMEALPAMARRKHAAPAHAATAGPSFGTVSATQSGPAARRRCRTRPSA